jgi:general secretion pathway protein D
MKFWCAFWICLLLYAGVSCEENKISMDFQGVDLNVFLQWFAGLTKKKIIYSDQRQGFGRKKVYLVAPEPVPEKSVEKICMSLLESNGFTLVKVGKGKSTVYKLVESSLAASKPIAIYSMEELSALEGSDYYISQLLVIKHLKVTNVIASLRQAKLLDPQVGSLVEITGVNALIICDFFPNVQRIVKMIRLLDKPFPTSEEEIIPLQYAKAEEMAQKLTQLAQGRTRELVNYHTQSHEPVIIADTRTNSLIVQASSKDMRRFKKLIRKLDLEVKESELVAKMYQLKHITPDKVLPTLKEFITTPLFQSKLALSSVGQPSSNISVIANDYARTLLVTAPQPAHGIIQEIIKKLDIRKSQVLLEAVICEFTPHDVLTFGIELLRLDEIGKSDGVFGHGVSSFGLSSIVDSSGMPVDPKKGTLATGRSMAPGSGLTAFMTKDRATNIPFLLKALQSVSYTDVISSPRILTDDGEQAEIRVQQEEPVTSTNALNSSTTTTSFKEFVAAGTVLSIKPQIIHDNWLRLEITQNIESFVGNSPSLGVPPPKSSRLLKTVVTVPNGHTIILGGLCGRREIDSIDKIPLLGDIPILGLLFQSRARTVSKTNLYIFITPKVLLHPEFEDLKGISKEEQKKAQSLRKKNGKH